MQQKLEKGNINKMLNLDTNITLATIKFFEIVFLFVLGSYIFYAFLLTKRVELMNRVFNTPKAKIFRFSAQLHLLITIIITLFTLILVLK